MWKTFCPYDWVCRETNLTHYHQSVNKPSLASDDTTHTWGDTLLGHHTNQTCGDGQRAVQFEHCQLGSLFKFNCANFSWVRPGNLDGCCEKHYSDQHIYDVKFAWFYTATKPSNHHLFNKSTNHDKFQRLLLLDQKIFNSWSVYTSRLRPSLYMASISVSGVLITSAYNRIITSDNSVYTTDAMSSHALPPNVVWVIQTHVLRWI